MSVSPNKEPVVETEAPQDAGKPKNEVQRGFIAEWTVTIILLLFGTTTLVQAFVIPTGSMEGNLLIGDHMLVDRLAYSDPGILGGRLLPYRSIQHGDIVAFRYPLDPSQTYVKRVIGIPGDRIRLENQQVFQAVITCPRLQARRKSPLKPQKPA